MKTCYFSSFLILLSHILIGVFLSQLAIERPGMNDIDNKVLTNDEDIVQHVMIALRH